MIYNRSSKVDSLTHYFSWLKKKLFVTLLQDKVIFKFQKIHISMKIFFASNIQAD